jgi:hypothetical protein
MMDTKKSIIATPEMKVAGSMALHDFDVGDVRNDGA